jgi:hypothetical protein
LDEETKLMLVIVGVALAGAICLGFSLALAAIFIPSRDAGIPNLRP